MLSQDEAAVADLAALAHDLRKPPLAVGLRELAELWTYESFRFLCARPAEMEDYPELSERIRGAFGAALHRQPEPRTASRRARAHPYDVLFAAVPVVAADPAKPVVIRAWLEGRRLIVELRVFGSAIGWRDEAAAAMLDALHQGIALRAAPRAQRVRVEPERVEHRRVSLLDVPHGTAGLLRFRSPFTVRRHGINHADPGALLPAMLGRVQRMAPWQACRLALPVESIEAAIAAVQMDALRWDRVAWQRHTRNRGDAAVPMEGWLGELRLARLTGDLAAIIALAETCNAGSHTALGMGWFEWLPD